MRHQLDRMQAEYSRLMSQGIDASELANAIHALQAEIELHEVASLRNELRHAIERKLGRSIHAI